MEIFRTPDENFDHLPDYPFEPRYVELESGEYPAGPPIRMHYVDAGSREAEPVLMLHGEPTWSFSYRKMISKLVEEGYRAIAPDHIGFGRSDKPVARSQYSFAAHIEWMRQFVVNALSIIFNAECAGLGGFHNQWMLRVLVLPQCQSTLLHTRGQPPLQTRG